MCNREFEPDEGWVKDQPEIVLQELVVAPLKTYEFKCHIVTTAGRAGILTATVKMAQAAEEAAISMKQLSLALPSQFRGTIDNISLTEWLQEEARETRPNYNNRPNKPYDRFLPKPNGRKR